MASKRFTKDGNAGGNEMEDRDPTPDEIAAIVPGDFTPQITAKYDPSRDDDADDEPVVPPAPGPADFQRMIAAMESISQRQTESNDATLAGALAQLATAIAGMKEGVMQGAQLQADMQRRTQLPENRTPPLISAFNPRGDKDFPRPQLKCPMFIPWPVEPESQTREEIELLNLLEPGEYYVVRTDRSRVKVTVRVERKLDSEEPSKILVNHETAFNNDYHKLMPWDWLRQVVSANPKTKARAQAVLTMDEEIALIAAKKLNDGTMAAQVVSVGV